MKRSTAADTSTSLCKVHHTQVEKTHENPGYRRRVAHVAHGLARGQNIKLCLIFSGAAPDRLSWHKNFGFWQKKVLEAYSTSNFGADWYQIIHRTGDFKNKIKKALSVSLAHVGVLLSLSLPLFLLLSCFHPIRLSATESTGWCNVSRYVAQCIDLVTPWAKNFRNLRTTPCFPTACVVCKITLTAQNALHTHLVQRLASPLCVWLALVNAQAAQSLLWDTTSEIGFDCFHPTDNSFHFWDSHSHHTHRVCARRRGQISRAQRWATAFVGKPHEKPG